ncbi:mitochondrial carrier domain-containing protein [Fimicolochytrium jonesii]|uniref:mitochondrial carrier domain-containing protein n=1 Tax=Fimicolochytrium jonesii TaxID=1396493 RepID=UPI0022FE03B3|nr:mitochondrial carrier domain-containing protein [Fimicolochytrium jonesii]KAI8827274.1 mitochondrial carrier domain-containing protein [Fimicolochytrium jonesii]
MGDSEQSCHFGERSEPLSSIVCDNERSRSLLRAEYSFIHHPSTLIPSHIYQFLFEQPKREQGISVLFKVADRRKRDLISESDFVSFQNVVRGPNAEFEVAFRLFDTNGDGKVTFDQFKQILSSIQGTESVATDFNSEWFTLFVGKKPRDISYEEFAQLLKGYQAERLKQEFKHYDSKGSGHIDPQAFRQIMLHVAKHKLSPFVTEHLPSLSQLYPGDNISFANLRACYNVIRQMDMVERITRKAAALTKDSCVSKADFKAAAAQMMRFNMLTPMEVDIFFHLAGRDFDTETTRLPIAAFERLFDPNYNASDPQAIRDHASAFVATNSDVTDLARQVVQLSAAMEALKSIYNFTLGAIAGAIGATVVYPIDLVKTRMQNQRASATSQLLYKNSIDCFQKVIKREGVMGLYSGLLPQLVGVAPEKAIKLTMNDLVRSHLRDKRTGEITLAGEILAGCTAGGSQVLFTNPLEIVKIRLQVQGEAAKTAAEATPRYSALQIVRQLGLLGLYRGVGACLLRDIPFSAIYFPTYAHLKKGLFDEGVEGKRLGAFELLTAGAIAGMPAAYLVTPADVIKTRLQVAARKGETTYTGITDAFRKILREEGPRAFFKGGLARVFRSSPQFGVTLASYEFLHRLFPVDFGDQRTEMVVRKARSTASGGGGDGEANVQTRGGFADTGARNALRVLNEINPELVASVGTRA